MKRHESNWVFDEQSVELLELDDVVSKKKIKENSKPSAISSVEYYAKKFGIETDLNSKERFDSFEIQRKNILDEFNDSYAKLVTQNYKVTRREEQSVDSESLSETSVPVEKTIRSEIANRSEKKTENTPNLELDQHTKVNDVQESESDDTTTRMVVGWVTFRTDIFEKPHSTKVNQSPVNNQKYFLYRPQVEVQPVTAPAKETAEEKAEELDVQRVQTVTAPAKDTAEEKAEELDVQRVQTVTAPAKDTAEEKAEEESQKHQAQHEDQTLPAIPSKFGDIVELQNCLKAELLKKGASRYEMRVNLKKVYRAIEDIHKLKYTVAKNIKRYQEIQKS